MKNFIIILILTAITSGCASNKPIKRVVLTPITFRIFDEVVSEKNYKLGEIKNIFVGEELVKRKTYRLKKQSKLIGVPPVETVLDSKTFRITLYRDNEYPVKYKRNKNGKVYNVMDVPYGNQSTLRVAFDEYGRIDNKMLDGDIEMPSSFEIHPLSAIIKLQQVENVVGQDVLENFEIVFSGINNDQINFTYREYNPDDIARTAFFQELTYPLSADIIRYKSLKIKVLKVNGESIRYQIIEE